MFVIFPVYIVGSLQNVSENGLLAMVPFALGTRLNNFLPQNVHSPMLDPSSPSRE